MKLVAAVILTAGMSGCVALMPPEERAYLYRVERITATSFTIPADKATEAREKAAWFIARYATLGLNVVSDTIITSHSPPKLSGRIYNYAVSFFPEDGQVRVAVECWSFSRAAGDWDTARNAGILADFLQGGKLRGIFVIS